MVTLLTTSAPNTMLTVGHSNHSIACFIGHLKAHGVTLVVDVRTYPRSRWAPHFNQDPLAASLAREGVSYAFMGDRLGGRPSDPGLYVDGAVQYEEVAMTPHFQNALDCVVGLLAKHRPALMCAEADPLACHRTLLVAEQLAKRGVAVTHILPDGGGETHEGLISRLIERWNLSDNDLFKCYEQRRAEAIARQAGRIGFRRPPSHD